LEKFIVKLVANGIFVVPLLMWLGGASFVGALITAVVLCVIAYLLGDQIILRSSNNTVASLADAVIAFVFLWAVGYYMRWTLTFAELLTIAVVVGIVEAFFHRYLGMRDVKAR
jgi:membrane protein DedA with SNARE-associated domain